MIPSSIQGVFTFMLALRSKMPKCSGPLPKLLLSHTKVEMPRFAIHLGQKFCIGLKVDAFDGYMTIL